ncbi:MAG: DUF1595 domain-containing protein [Archangiaceae bacterium]|nr:DUF1595 domain-containing protein [Archangiaceae bacterium]
MKTSLRLVLLLLAACEGQISAIGAGRGGGGPVDPGQTMREHTDPTLEELAQKYFPGDDATPPARRLFRLTRAQLDATTRALLPAQFGESISATMPRDPLRTNYEYATDLGFSDASFTPYVSWVAALATRVKASPASVVSCAADATACQQTAAKAFVQRAFRGAAAPAQLQRYADLFTSSVTSVGLPQATADLVDVTLAAPAYVFRDEVSTDATGALLSLRSRCRTSPTRSPMRLRRRWGWTRRCRPPTRSSACSPRPRRARS